MAYFIRMRHTLDATGSRRFPRLNRVAIVAYALFQIILPGALAVADGWTAAENGSRAYVTHVEGLGGHGCPRPHEADSCVVCRLLANFSATCARAAIPHVAHVLAATAISSRLRPGEVSDAHAPSLPRAPPVA